ncbi:hypothetical protein GW17_00019934 [Ensete ventricosum]|nr:hypothetical protein GW17_00019934 [Ensete ventricosum]
MGGMYWLERIPVCGPPSTGWYQCFDLYRGVPTGITLDFDRYWSVHLDVVDGGIFKVFRVGALQDVRSELAKLRGTLFYKVLEELHSHIYNKGEYT